MVKAVTLGLIDSAEPTARHLAVRALFDGAGFSVTEVADFRSWLWFHFILDAGLMAGIRTAGGFDAYVRSTTASRLTVELIDEMTAVLEAKGGVRRAGAKAFRTLPTGVVAFGLRRLLGGDNLYGHLMRLVLASAHGSPEMTAMYPRRVLAEARRLGVEVPRLQALEPLFA
ncbi:hypothetical protein [Brevibacterium celere]|uniref:ketopantoate reductase family protein n=1 Tax=Brevibacterium celere TaxID=225845 RepID=UPI0031D01C42